MKTELASPPWQTLGAVPVVDLVDAKLQLHWAAQIVSAFGNTLLETRPDDSQSNLGWELFQESIKNFAELLTLSIPLSPDPRMI